MNYPVLAIIAAAFVAAAILLCTDPARAAQSNVCIIVDDAGNEHEIPCYLLPWEREA